MKDFPYNPKSEDSSSSSKIQINPHGVRFVLGLRSAKQNEGMKEMLNRAHVVVIIESVTHHTAVSAEPSLQQAPAPTLACWGNI